MNFVRPVAPTKCANPPRGTRELERGQAILEWNNDKPYWNAMMTYDTGME